MKWFNVKVQFESGFSESWNVFASDSGHAMHRLPQVVCLAVYGPLVRMDVREKA